MAKKKAKGGKKSARLSEKALRKVAGGESMLMNASGFLKNFSAGIPNSEAGIIMNSEAGIIKNRRRII